MCIYRRAQGGMVRQNIAACFDSSTPGSIRRCVTVMDLAVLNDIYSFPSLHIIHLCSVLEPLLTLDLSAAPQAELFEFQTEGPGSWLSCSTSFASSLCLCLFLPVSLSLLLCVSVSSSLFLSLPVCVSFSSSLCLRRFLCVSFSFSLSLSLSDQYILQAEVGFECQSGACFEIWFD